MLSSRDTPFSDDGWALVIEDIRRLSLLVGGGANDLNAGAIDADQQALNDLSSALNSHEVDPAAHAALFAAVNTAIAAAAAAAFTPTYVISNSGSGTTQSVTGTQQLTTCIPDATGTGGMALSSGVFTAPATGVYHAIANIGLSYSTSAAGQSDHFMEILSSTGFGVVHEGVCSLVANGAKIQEAVVSGYFSLSSGQTLKFYTSLGYSGTISVGPNVFVNQVSIARIL